MLGIVLLYVGIVLINNGISRLYNIDEKSAAVMNIFTGALAVIIDTVSVIQGEYYAVGTGLLFGFTYLFIAFLNVPLGIFVTLSFNLFMIYLLLRYLSAIDINMK